MKMSHPFPDFVRSSTVYTLVDCPGMTTRTLVPNFTHVGAAMVRPARGMVLCAVRPLSREQHLRQPQ